ALDQVGRQAGGLALGGVDDRPADAAHVVEEGQAGDAAVGDAHCAGPGLAGQLFGVRVPGQPRGGVVVNEDNGVPGGDVAAAAGGNRIKPVGADEPGLQAMLLQVLGPNPAHCEVQAAVGDPGGLDVGGRDPRVDVDLGQR